MVRSKPKTSAEGKKPVDNKTKTANSELTNINKKWVLWGVVCKFII